MHQKILIVDQKQVFLGSANLTPSSLSMHGNLVMGIENEALADKLTKRAKSMDEEGHVTPLLHQETAAGEQKVELWMLPDDPKGVKRMIELFRAAQKSIQVAMFTWTRFDFTQELIAAAKRGVKVEAVIDHNSGKGSSAKIVEMLAKAGIPVKLSKGPGLLHHKFAYIDREILVNGSANWTSAAFKSNDDVFMVIWPLTDTQRIKMDDLYSVIQKQSEIPKKASQKMTKLKAAA
jgi:phosphatidylserine/phosphatidylglycerophosphate/cardiolipin synthase-like enzyme